MVMNPHDRRDLNQAIAAAVGLIILTIILTLMSCTTPRRSGPTDLYQTVRPGLFIHPYPVTY